MSLNWKEVDCIISEINFIGGKIQNILQADLQTLYMEIYHASLYHFFIHLTQNEVRMHLSPSAPKKPNRPQRFQQLLQSRIIGSVITNVEHIDQNRIVRFTCTRHNHDDNTVQTMFLYTRLWSNQANILLTQQDNTIVDLIYRRPQQSLMPKKIFILPPPSQNERHAKAQIRMRDATSYEHSNTPFNEYINDYYQQKIDRTRQDKHHKKLLTQVEKHINQFSTRMQHTKEQIQQHTHHERHKEYGDHILNHIHSIIPRQAWLTARNDITGEEIIIPIDPSISPSQNAEKYFNKANRSKRIFSALKNQQTVLEKNYQSLKTAQTLLNTEPDQEITDNTLATVQSMLKKIKIKDPNIPTQTKQKNADDIIVGMRLQQGMMLFFIGRNVKENDQLLRRAKGNDTWLHVRGQSGAYVFVRCPKEKNIPLSTLIQGGQLAAFYSKVSDHTDVDVYYTQVKYLKKIKKSIGLVIPMRDKNLHIKTNHAITRTFLHTHSV